MTSREDAEALRQVIQGEAGDLVQLVTGATPEGLWIEIVVDGESHSYIGPFETELQCELVLETLAAFIRANGGVATPGTLH